MHYSNNKSRGCLALLAISVTGGWWMISPASATAQEAVMAVEGGQPVVVEGQGRGRRPGGPQPGQPGQPPGQPGQPGQPPNGEQKKDDKDKKEGDDKDKKEEDTSVKRPEKPPRVPDPREMEVTLDDKGRVPAFNFIGQPWPDVMQWLASLSKCSLDWQELPNDYLNLTTQKAYSLEELRDLINRHLHARGYTSIQVGEVLSVFKIDKLDPSLVRRVTEDELYDLKPYDFVKVSFELPQGMEVEKAKDDVKQVLSPNAKVFPLVSTKRLLLIDAVANLRLVSGLLNEERAVQSGRIVPNEFVLQYARAEQVIETLYAVLGMDQKSRSNPQMDAQMQQQQMQMMQQMQQQGKDVSKMMKKEGPPVYLALNRQRNSVLANAPPEQMRVIEQTIEYLDVPLDGTAAVTTDVVGAGSGDSLRMQRYQLVTLDPERLVSTLVEVGDLSPRVELRADSRSKSLFVSRASAADHEKIRRLIDDLDGSGRQFEVIQLRKLPADLVAATIVNLMVGKEEEKKDNNPPWWGYRDRGNNNEDEKPNKGFRVDADIESNRLMLWASDSELAEVNRLLEKMGELPGKASDPRPVRFVQQEDAADTAKLLERLRAAWSATGNNELIIKAPEKPAVAIPPKKKEADKKSATEPAADRSAGSPSRIIAPVRLVQLKVPAARDESADAKSPAESAKETTNAAPTDRDGENPSPDRAATAATTSAPMTTEPITITVAEDGQLMLSSKDTAALDRLEELIDQLSPSEKRFKVYRLQYITALNMKWNLEDLFKEELKGDSAGYIRDYWSGDLMPRGGQDKSGGGLSKRRKLMITWDTPSNSILVANATPAQLIEIEQLIAEYDQPAPADSVKTRHTVPIKIRFSKAKVIADALKEVYRDLLSSRDKEFEKGEQKDRGSSTERVTMIRYGNSPTSDNSSSQRPSPVKVGFEGALSVGVDEIANVIIISVQEELFDSVVAMVHKLDQEAAPDTTVLVRRVSGSVTAESLQKALSQAVGKPWVGGRPEAEPKPKEENAGKEGEKKNQNGDGNNGDQNRSAVFRGY